MAPESKPAVLFVHGGYHLPKAYAPFLQHLSAANFVTRCPHLPTNGDARPPKATFHDDVAAVRAAAVELISAGHRIIVLAHSWGGLVASEAVVEDLYAKDMRHDEDGGAITAGVVRMIYVSAWLIQPGTSLPLLFQKYGFQSGVKMDIDPDQISRVTNASEAFYNDVDSDTAQRLTRELVTFNFKEISTEGAATVVYAPWKDLPSAFVLCTKDKGIFLDLQRSMVRDAVQGGARDLKVFELESGHFPFWSMPERVVGIVEEIWRSCLGS